MTKKKDAAGWNLNEASHDQVAKPPCLFLEEEDGRCWAFFRRGKVIWQISVSWEMADGERTFLEVLKRGRGGKFFYCIYGVKSRKIHFFFKKKHFTIFFFFSGPVLIGHGYFFIITGEFQIFRAWHR